LVASSDGSPEVRVVFGIEVESGRFLIEPDPSDLVLRERSYHRLRGCLRIRWGQLPPVAPEDEIIALVANVCFAAVREVLTDLHVAVNYTDTYGYLRLDREGDTVRLSGDRVADIRVPTRSLLVALVECGARFRAWLPSCDLDGDLDEITGHLEAEEALTRAALAAE
jgi:hypothetical protein